MKTSLEVQDFCETSIIFYKRDQHDIQYCLFKGRYNQYTFINGVVLEDESCSHTLSAARIIMEQINPSFTVDHLNKNLDINLNQKIDSWYALFNDYTYYQWCNYMGNQEFWHNDNRKRFLYFLQINEFGLKNLEKCGKQIKLFTHDQLMLSVINQEKLVSLTTKQILKEYHLDYIFKQIEEFQQAPYRRSNTFILFINKPIEIDRFVKNQPYIPTEQVMKGIFKQKLEHWLTYRSAMNQFPSDEILNQAGCIIIPGSLASAYDNLPWVINFRNWIHYVYQNFPHIKFLGICFGEQILAQSLGGFTDKMEKRKKIPNYYKLGFYECKLYDSFCELDCIQGIDFGNKKTLSLMKAHGDIVKKIPNDCILLADSELGVEMYTSKDQRILAFQAHPEFSLSFSNKKNAEIFHAMFNKEKDPVIIEEYLKRKRYCCNTDDICKVRQAINRFIRIPKRDLNAQQCTPRL